MSKSGHLFVAGLAAATLANSAQSVAFAEDVTRLSICDLEGGHRKYNGEHVEIHANVRSTALEYGDWLYDKKCPEMAVRLFISNYKDVKVSELFNDIYRNPPLGTAYKDISADFRGRLLYEGHNYFPTLILEAAETVSVTPKPIR